MSMDILKEFKLKETLENESLYIVYGSSLVGTGIDLIILIFNFTDD